MNKLDEIVEKIINVDKANLSSYFEKTMWTRFEMGQKEQVKKRLITTKCAGLQYCRSVGFKKHSTITRDRQ